MTPLCQQHVMELPLQVPLALLQSGHQCASKDQVGFALIFHDYSHGFIAKTSTLPLCLPLPPVSTPNRHDPQFTFSGNKRDIEVNLNATGVDGSVTPWSTKKLPHLFNVLNHIKSISCLARKRIKGSQIPEFFHGLFLLPESQKKLRAYTDQKFGEGPWSCTRHFSDTHELLVAKSHGIFFSLHLTQTTSSIWYGWFLPFPKKAFPFSGHSFSVALLVPSHLL